MGRKKFAKDTFDTILLSRIKTSWPSTVGNVCNPSYSRGGDRRIMMSRPLQPIKTGCGGSSVSYMGGINRRLSIQAGLGIKNKTLAPK
jgi:hypothetical protein